MAEVEISEEAMAALKPYAHFLFEVGLLAKTPRSGFRFLNGHRQSIAEHLHRTACIGLVLTYLEQERGVEVELSQVMIDCLFHDLGEARTGDLDYVSQKYTTANELQAVKDSVARLPFGPLIVNSYVETENQSNDAGTIAKDADQLELLFALKEISENGNIHSKDWVDSAVQRLKTPSAKLLAQVILTTNANEWWSMIGDKEYWIKGGKTKVIQED